MQAEVLQLSGVTASVVVVQQALAWYEASLSEARGALGDVKTVVLELDAVPQTGHQNQCCAAR